MPELPEIETIRVQLNELILDKKIESVRVNLPAIVYADSLSMEADVAGAKVTGVDRRAKMLVLALSTGSYLVFHLKMSGQILFVDPDKPENSHTHFVLGINGHELRFREPRKFGWVKRVNDLEKEFSNIGFEPLDKKFTLKVFADALTKRHNRKIKPLLLDQSFIAGIGNIYADEVLFRAKVRPERVVGSLGDAETERIFKAIKETLKRAIEKRGTSITGYVDSLGEKGSNQEALLVYGRQDERCPVCDEPIRKIKVAGRGTYFCPRCQK